MKWAATLVCFASLLAQGQEFSQRGFVELSSNFYPQTFPIDSARAIGGILARYEPKWQPTPWFTLNASFDLRTDSHQQVARDVHFDWQDRSLQRSPLSVRQLAAVLQKGNFTITLGKQFIRWGEADFLNPTDRFAPTDLLNLVDQELLPVTAAKVAYNRGDNGFNLVWQPEFTPTRIPLIDQRWTFLPPAYYFFKAQDLGSIFPGRSSFGVRWSHAAAHFEYSLCYYDGFNYTPDFKVQVDATASRLTYSRIYPSLRLYGGDLTVPLSLVTFKSEGAYYTSPAKNQDQYLLYLLQLERQMREVHVILGYAGEMVTARANVFQYLGERGFARGLILHVLYALDTNRAVTLETFVRQNGASSLVSPAFSQSFREHWRATVGIAWLRGEAGDFLGQYHRNSFARVELRYSF